MESLPSGCGACREAAPIMPFTMAFQPIVNIVDERIVAHEALVRGPAGEGAMSVLTRVTGEALYAFDQACRIKAIEMAARLGMPTGLNINFLPRAVYEPRACLRLTLEAAARHGFPLDRMTFEIVEHEEVSEVSHLANIVEEYRRRGCKVAMDDFATGYSGLARLAVLKPDIIKLDRILVQDCDLDRSRLAIIASMTSLARDLGIKVVVEGVERAGEVAALRQVGARYMQGFYFARPIFEGIAAPSDIVWPSRMAVSEPETVSEA